MASPTENSSCVRKHVSQTVDHGVSLCNAMDMSLCVRCERIAVGAVTSRAVFHLFERKLARNSRSGTVIIANELHLFSS